VTYKVFRESIEDHVPLFYSLDSRSFLIATQTNAMQNVPPRVIRKRDGKKVTNKEPQLGETYLLEMVNIEPLTGKAKISDDESFDLDDGCLCESEEETQDVALLRKDVARANNNINVAKRK
jgi:hypothetical protein